MHQFCAGHPADELLVKRTEALLLRGSEELLPSESIGIDKSSRHEGVGHANSVAHHEQPGFPNSSCLPTRPGGELIATHRPLEQRYPVLPRALLSATQRPSSRSEIIEDADGAPVSTN